MIVLVPVAATTEPEVIDVVLMIMSVVAVPAVPWSTTVPPACVRMRKKVSVSVASALESCVIVSSVPTAFGLPSVFDAKIDAEQVSVNSRSLPDSAASASAGMEPS